MRKVWVTGIGLALEEPIRGDWKDLARRPSRQASVVGIGGLERIVPTKERRLLAYADLLAIQAARLAREDAQLENLETEGMGCVVFSAGKATRATELVQERTRYRTADNRPDTSAFNAALLDGSASVDPMILLTQLDNAALWWLCKAYRLGPYNLQIAQVQNPDYVALVESVDAIAHGECEKILVGGFQTAEQSAVSYSNMDERYCAEDSERAAGAAMFLVLEATPSAPARAYGELLLSDSPDAADVGSRATRCGTPALSSFAEIFAIASAGRQLQPAAQKTHGLRPNGLSAGLALQFVVAS